MGETLGRLRGRKREVGIAIAAFSAGVVTTLIFVYAYSALREPDVKLAKAEPVAHAPSENAVVPKTEPAKAITGTDAAKNNVSPAPTSQEKDARRAALRAARKLSSAVSVGVSRESYGERLADTIADVDGALQDVSDGPFKEKVQAAMLAYRDASALWSHAMQWDFATIYLEQIKELVDRYELTFRDEPPAEFEKVFESEVSKAVYVSFPLSKIWTKADQYLTEAEQLASQ